MGLISEWCACASPLCAWIGTILRSSPDKTMLYVSPLSPTSFASLAVPAFGYAGNLWGWIPQVRVEHRIRSFEWTEHHCCRRHDGQCHWRIARRELRAPGASRREFGPAGLRGASVLDSQCFWHASDFRRRRLLQPPKLGLQQPCGWLGGNDGLEHSTDKSRHSYRRVLSRPSHGRAGWRSRAERALYRRSQSLCSVAAAEFGGRMVADQSQGYQQAGV